MSEHKNCKQCGNDFIVEEEDLKFYDKISPTFAPPASAGAEALRAGGKKYPIPTPTLCPACRNQRRLSWRNERNLFLRKCDKSGKRIVACYPEDSEYKIYAIDEWWKDDWQATDFSVDFDPNQSFINQLHELQKKVPRISLINVQSENSDFCNQAFAAKDSYMAFDSGWSEGVLYSRTIYKSKDIVDCFNCRSNCSYIYECIDCQNISNSSHCISSSDSNNCHYCYDVHGSKDCILSSNLRNKQYFIENKEYSKEEYEAKKKEFNLDSYRSRKELKTRFLDMMKNKSIHKYALNEKCEDCSGNNLSNSKNVKDSYGAGNCEDSKFLYYSIWLKDTYDDDFSGSDASCELNYENIGCHQPYSCKFCFSCWTGSANLFYCDFCHSSKDCFGCVGLRNKQYCILNKQYTKEEYEKKVAEIIEKMISDKEWGEFFPIEMSPHSYNLSMAGNYYPLTKSEVEEKGYRWKDKVDTLVPSDNYEIPDKIAEVKEDILGKVLKCDITNRPFKIQPRELAFYMQMGIPIPRIHFDQRYLDRFKLLNPFILHHRQCMCEESGHDHEGKCKVEFETTYAPERPEKIYCEDCYQKSVI